MTKINKEGWETKKLGEVASFLGGGTPSKKNDAYYTGDIPWATVRDMVSFELSETEYHITPEAVEESATNIIPRGTIVISTHVGLGKICVLMQDTAINQDLKAVIFNDEGAQLKGYFAYWYKSIADFIVSNGKGATVKGVTLDFMRNLPIPLPPLPIQRRIVEELDEINAIISAKKQQLTKLDELAQSIFYDMFGDPVANEKGWEKHPWKELFDTKLGKMLDAKKEPKDGVELPYLANFNVQWGRFDFSELRTLRFEESEIAKYELLKDDLLICEGGESGRCAVWKETDKTILFQKAIHRARIKDFNIINPIFTQFLLKLTKEAGGLKDYISKATIEHLTGAKLGTFPVILPPLPLQETFATRISAIEDQKSAITASIEKMQTLLDARMQEYFG